ncbi:MAG: 3',5'-cyclic-AMP phosphodiesterase [Gammaproteobacteria bacterium]
MTLLTTQDPIRLVQITDTHLYGNASGTLLKMNTQQSLEQVVKLLQANQPQLDFILATGDIAQDGSKDAYEYFLEKMQELDTPLTWVPGNHDNAQLMDSVSSESSVADTSVADKKVQINNWLIVFLNSSVAGQVHGRIDKNEYDFLNECLSVADSDASVDHCLLCLHHNPVKGNADWMRDIGLQDGDRFFETVGQYPKVKCVVYGHVHQELDFDHRGIRCICTPSTCIQFKPDVAHFTLDETKPGYRSMELFSNGEIKTEVHRIASDLSADMDSTGY